MKKVISLILAILLVGSMAVMASADDGQISGTGTDASKTSDLTLSYVGKGNEAYVVTVPATLAAGGTEGDVIVSGTWASNRLLTVACPETIVLTNAATGESLAPLAITFNGVSAENGSITGISLGGCNTEAVAETTYKISVADPNNDNLLGTWKGTINYTVAMADPPAAE